MRFVLFAEDVSYFFCKTNVGNKTRRIQQWKETISRLRTAAHVRFGLGTISYATTSVAGHTTGQTSTWTHASSGVRTVGRNPDRNLDTYGIIISKRGTKWTFWSLEKLGIPESQSNIPRIAKSECWKEEYPEKISDIAYSTERLLRLTFSQRITNQKNPFRAA